GEQLRIAQERLTEQESRHAAEIRDVRERLIQTNQLLHAKSVSHSEIDLQNKVLTEQLQRQLRATRKLRRFLEETEQAATRLRNSRRWQMSNAFAWLVTLFSRHPVSGFGHLDKVVDAFRKWLTMHPEARNIGDALQAVTPQPTTVAANLSLTSLEGGSAGNNNHDQPPPVS